MGEVMELMFDIINYLLDVIIEALIDETHRIVIVSLGIILVCLIMIYKNIKPPSLKKLSPQLSIDAIREAEKKVVTDLVDAVGEMKEFVLPKKPQRFRKRDRVWFYGRRMLRKMEDNVKYVEDVGMKSKKGGKQMIRNFTKRIFLGDSSENSSVADYTESRPAEDWLEEDSESLKWVPPELKYLLNSFHMFGQFDPSYFAELYPAIESLRVTAGQFLFRIGDPDRYIFVVQSGQLDVTTTDSFGTHYIKKVGHGESLTSLLSFIDVLTGHANPYKSVQAQARVDSIVLRLSMEAFLQIFDKNPELLIRVVQMVMARVQRVIFVGLHRYLGLSGELIRPMELVDLDSPDPMSLEMELALAGENSAVNNHSPKLNEGVRGLQRELDLEDDSYLKSVVQIREYDENEKIITEASHSDVALGYVIEGELTMYQMDNDKMDKLYSAEKGECFGQLSMLTGEASFYTCKATKPTIVALLSKSSFFSIVSETPEMVLSLAHSTIKRLSPLVRKIDFALDWLTVEAGRAVSASAQENTLLLLSGRLRGYTVAKNGVKQLCGEYGRGDMVGIVDAITGVKQRKTYLSVRDSEICVIPGQLLEFLKARSMVVMTKLINILGKRLVSGQHLPGDKASEESETPTVKYNSIAVFANKLNVPILQFCYELENSLSVNGPVARLSSRIIKAKLGQTALDGGHDYRLNSWLGQQDDRHSCVIYQCDPTVTEWTKKCLRHADLVLVLAAAGDGAEVTETEREFEGLAKRIRKELVLLWDQDTQHPTGTREWLKRRAWLSGHIHVKMPERMTKYKTDGKINKQYAALANSVPDIHSDFSRVARALQGKSIGLVLGGGGARGAAHLGMLKSIVEAGIPIDKVGGVSIGAFMTGLWALHRNIGNVSSKSQEWFEWMTNPINLMDLTYPITSLFSGAYFNSSIKTTFPDTINIEDLWLPFYCVSTDISTSTERVHRTGTLWRYVRASMSYAWIIPPICDPVDGHMLMDGCYVNNVPGDVMLKSSCSHIIVVDVTAPDDTELTNYGDSLSGWWMLWKKWNPFSSPVKIPTQEGIQERLAFCSHYKNLDALKRNPHYEYIQPPVGHFSSSKFALFEEIQRVGYHHGTTFFCGLKKAGKSEKFSPNVGPWLPTSDRAKRMSRVNTSRRDSGNYTFTDLAQMVVSGVKVGRDWQNKKNKNSPEASHRDQDSDDTGIML